MNRLEKLFGTTRLDFAEFSAAVKDAGLLILEGTEDSYIPASREAELLADIAAEKEAHKVQLSRLRAEGAVREALIRSGAHNPDVALRAVDLSDLDGSADSVYTAAEAKAASLKSSEPYLFRSEGPSVSTGASHGTGVADTDLMSDSEYYRHINLK